MDNYQVKADPDVRKDGLCAHPDCGQPRKSEKTIDHDDPFCSVECCRDWHDVHVQYAKAA